MAYGLFKIKLPDQAWETTAHWEQRRQINDIVNNIERPHPGGYIYYHCVYRKESIYDADEGRFKTERYSLYSLAVIGMSERQVEIFKDLGYDVTLHKGKMRRSQRKGNYKRLRRS